MISGTIRLQCLPLIREEGCANKQKRPRRLRREARVFAHLERVSKKLLVEHPDIVRALIGRNAGVYALYRKNKLYCLAALRSDAVPPYSSASPARCSCPPDRCADPTTAPTT